VDLVDIARFDPPPAVLPSLPDTPYVDLRTTLPLAAAVRNQPWDDCVGEYIALANWIAVGCAGARGSPDGVYRDARARERARLTSPLADTGCQTTDALDAVCSTGIYPADAADGKAVNTVESVDEALARVRIDPLLLEPLYDGDTATLDGWLQRGMCAGFTMRVPAGYSNLSAASPVYTDTAGADSAGYHRQVIVGRAMVGGVPCYIVQNSWGTYWGDAGFGYIPCATFGGIGTEVVVHKGGVLL
jgi:hypothetical protein